MEVVTPASSSPEASSEVIDFSSQSVPFNQLSLQPESISETQVHSEPQPYLKVLPD